LNILATYERTDRRTATGENMAYSIENIPATSSLLIGTGINMVTGEAVATALTTLKATKTSYPAGGPISTNCIQTEQTYSDLIDVLVSAEGSAWTEDGKFSVGASAQYIYSENFSEQTLAFTMYRYSIVEKEFPTDAQFAALQLPPAMAAQILNNPDDFLTAYGTHVVVGFLYGGAILCGVKVECVSVQDMTTVKAAFNLSINEFGEGNGSLDSNFQANLKSYQSSYTFTALANPVGVTPPTFDISDVSAMDDYINNQFEEQLSTGGIAMIAICYPWEMLPCVKNLPNYKQGSLSPAIDPTVIPTLKDEYRLASYGLTTAKSMDSNACFVGQTARTALEADKVALYAAQGNIGNLTFTQLQALNAATVTQYVVSEAYIVDLQEIAAGRAAVTWWAFLDSTFTPGNGALPGPTPPDSYFPTPDQTPQYVQSSNHGGPEAQLGFAYQLNQAKPGTQLQDLAQLTGVFNAWGTLFWGTPVGTTPGGESVGCWDQHDYQDNRIKVSFG
jgi:hypothetical protein